MLIHRGRIIAVELVVRLSKPPGLDPILTMQELRARLRAECSFSSLARMSYRVAQESLGLD
jgi:hypothetical protein